MKISTLFSTLLMIAFLSTHASAALVEYSSGHGDIGLAFEDGELELHYHFGDGAVLDGAPLAGEIEFAPDEAYVRVGDNAQTNVTGNVPFLGLTSGDPVWTLPSTSISGRPFLGIASEELSAADFSSATLSLTAFSGPGQFALWQAGSFGGANVFWQTLGGLDSTDLLNMAIGGHDHFNYGFTTEGIYDLELTAVANLVGGGSVTDVGTFRFLVGSATAVPEPSSFAMLATAMVVGGAIYRRRKRR
ncbi:hypothetical protein Poly51_21700 [Rubripirellula tenax]|uniref:PEP-CTERM protein-sorting domain-containing protein n=1 Tax=Rubripirellula tenax TaxID=2528015 RepID=A0A5C6FF62_9BACT|nr:choice-of-anchor M domain-containing protein [Rubripirellula tenax]TWU59382.1 hypothetical protein Poly51_21700 [Rubripirellula tenax]